jgi:hypothetical protein
VVSAPHLTKTQRMAVAKISGSADRLTVGRDKHVSRAEAIAELHEITTDPVALGTVLGNRLYRVEREGASGLATVDLLRAAGADEDAAAAKLAWLKRRDEGYEGGFRL